MIPTPHSANVYRPNLVQGTGQQIGNYSLVYSCVACFVQPTASTEDFFFQQRGDENTASIYLNYEGYSFLRNDVFIWNNQEYHITGVQSGLNLNLYWELTAVYYPEGAKKRIDIVDYPVID